MSDLIRREDAFSKFEKACTCDSVDKNGMKRGEIKIALTWEGIRNILENIPSAEPERKKGAWTGDCCSCCGVSKYNYIKMVDDECGPFGTWNFCPHCGARLEWE